MLGLVGAFITLGVTPASAQIAAPDITRFSTSTAAADHRSLAAHYRAHAVAHETDAARHDALAAEVKARAADDDAWDLARDASHYAQHSREAAEALRDLAQLHEAIADRLDAAKGTGAAPAARWCGGKGKPGEKGEEKPPAPQNEYPER
jgi:hypothetical protein